MVISESVHGERQEPPTWMVAKSQESKYLRQYQVRVTSKQRM